MTLVIHGKSGERKTSRACQLVSDLRQRGYTVGGIVAHGLRSEGLRSGFDLEELLSGNRVPLARAGQVSPVRIGRFGFSREGIAFGREALALPRLRRADLIVIDEVGPWELEGNGWSRELDRLSALPVPMVMTVRTSLVDEVTRRWGKRDAAVFAAQGVTSQQILDALQTQYPA
ncbi:MAG: nucleoside-triphosphatase [Acidobacteriota bacterium]|nr:nucleoside-triphosphatase [Acidobacteriota bacterium]